MRHPTRTPPVSVFTTLDLTSEETAAIDAGRPVVKVQPWGGPAEVYVFGAIHVDGSPETYLKAARDVRRLSGTPGYLGIGELHDDAAAGGSQRVRLRAGRREGVEELS